MSAYETETRENLKADAARFIRAIRLQLLIVMEALGNTDDYQAIIKTALKESTADLVPATALVDQVKEMLWQTSRVKTHATLIHENTLKLDNALTQLEALEKEAEK